MTSSNCRVPLAFAKPTEPQFFFDRQKRLERLDRAVAVRIPAGLRAGRLKKGGVSMSAVLTFIPAATACSN
jgi:hypothetical protein